MVAVGLIALVLLSFIALTDILRYRAPVVIDGRFEDWVDRGDLRIDPRGDTSSHLTLAVAHHRYPAAGTYEASLTVFDTIGQEGQVALTIPVPNRAPIGVFDHHIINLTAYFDGSSSRDPEGSSLSFVWDFGDGLTASGVSAEHTYDDAGYYPVTLTVVDEWSASAIAEKVLIVGKPDATRENSPPVPHFTLSVVEYSVEVNASSSLDPDGHAVLARWDFGDGSTAAGMTATHEYGDPGRYEISLVVNDDLGAQATKVVSVDVPNHRPSAHIDVTSRNLKYSLDGSRSADMDGDSLSYFWSLGDGGAASGPHVTHLYARPGQYRLGLTVTDSHGASNATSRLLTVRADEYPNTMPVVAVTWEVSGYFLRVSAEESYDVDGEVVAVHWDFGDGVLGQGVRTSHLYEGSGIFGVKASVYDNEGGLGTALHSIVVDPPSPFDRPPVPRARVAIVDYEVELDARASSDDDTIAGYLWEFGDQAAGPDIVEARTQVIGGGLFYYFSLGKDVVTALCECVFEIWIDSDGNPSTGFFTEVMGADFSILFHVDERGSAKGFLRWYAEDSSSGLQRWWQLYAVPIAFDGKRGEGVVWESDLLNTDLSPVRMSMSVVDLDGRSDDAEVR